MFRRLGESVSRYWLAVIIGWAALLPLLGWLAPSWNSVTNDGDLAYLPERMTTVQGERLWAEAFPDNRTRSQFVLVFERDGGLTQEDIDGVVRLAGRFSPDADHELPITGMASPASEVVGRRLISADRQAALVIFNLDREFVTVSNIAALTQVRQTVNDAQHAGWLPADLRVGITGSAAVGGDMLAAAEESIRNIEISTVILVVVILLLVYRAPLLAVIPIASIAVSVFVALHLIALLTQVHTLPGCEWIGYKVFKTTRIFIVVILFGSGTDFCLFLISRYREELERGLDRAQAVAAAVEHIGEAVFGSALTTIFGLGAMFFADFGKFSNSGPTIALCLLVTLVACLTLAPAILRGIGRGVFWPVHVRPRAPSAENGAAEAPASAFWDALSRAIIARPGLILVASVVLLAPFAYEGWQGVAISFDLVADLPANRTSVVGAKMLREHFPAGETGPITILAYQPRSGLDTDEGEREIARLTKLLFDVEGVQSVRSLTEPLGDKPGTGNTPLTPAGRRKLAARKNPRAQAMYLTHVPELAGQVTRLDVITAFDPFSRRASNVVDALEERLNELSHDPDSPWQGAVFEFAGPTAGTRDLRMVTASDQTLIQRLVLLAVYLVLLVVLRRPLISIYLVLSVLFSYYVTIGATEMLFRGIYADFEGLDWKVPLFLFVILIAVGEDYNIYLASRVFEEQRRRGLLDGLRVAVVRTGGIITSCGIIMAGSFVSMLTGTMRGIVELGFALSLGVMLDTLVVRPVLVPAFLALCWRGDRSRGHAPQATQTSTPPPTLTHPNGNGQPQAAAVIEVESGRAE